MLSQVMRTRSHRMAIPNLHMVTFMSTQMSCSIGIMTLLGQVNTYRLMQESMLIRHNSSKRILLFLMMHKRLHRTWMLINELMLKEKILKWISK